MPAEGGRHFAVPAQKNNVLQCLRAFFVFACYSNVMRDTYSGAEKKLPVLPNNEN